jgi:predicted metal-binding membrane protein
MSAFSLEDGVVYHTYSTYARGLDSLWGMFSGSTAHPRDAMKRVCGGDETTSTRVEGQIMVNVDQLRDWRFSRCLIPDRPAEGVFYGVCALLFAASSALTIGWSITMPPIEGMPMPGGWAMSMAWMRMPGQTWVGAAASFVGMWIVMMVAMMLPSLAPALWRYREALSKAGDVYPGQSTALLASGYFLVWAVAGVTIFPFGVALAAMEMQYAALARAVPMAGAVVVVMAGAFQLSAWRAHRLACCREAPGHDDASGADALTAWRKGVRHGRDCVCGCAGLTAILLVAGVMNLRAMAAITAAITLERVVPGGERIARLTGTVAIGAGLFLMTQAAALG